MVLKTNVPLQQLEPQVQMESMLVQASDHRRSCLACPNALLTNPLQFPCCCYFGAMLHVLFFDRIPFQPSFGAVVQGQPAVLVHLAVLQFEILALPAWAEFQLRLC